MEFGDKLKMTEIARKQFRRGLDTARFICLSKTDPDCAYILIDGRAAPEKWCLAHWYRIDHEPAPQ